MHASRSRRVRSCLKSTLHVVCIQLLRGAQTAQRVVRLERVDEQAQQQVDARRVGQSFWSKAIQCSSKRSSILLCVCGSASCERMSTPPTGTCLRSKRALAATPNCPAPPNTTLPSRRQVKLFCGASSNARSAACMRSGSSENRSSGQ
jgi:hypothetical protein